jgi:hypothetical protein
VDSNGFNYGCSNCPTNCVPIQGCPLKTLLGGGVIDWEREDCVWNDRVAGDERVVWFEGGSLSMKRCKFLNCGNYGQNGAGIQCFWFTGDVLLEEVECIGVTGDNGFVAFSNRNPRSVRIEKCLFSYGHFRTGGFIVSMDEGLAGQRLSLYLRDTKILNTVTNDGYGAIYGVQPYYSFERCIFENCTVAPFDDERGSFVRVSPDSAVDAHILFDYCVLDNHDLPGPSLSGVVVNGFAGSSCLVEFMNTIL